MTLPELAESIMFCSHFTEVKLIKERITENVALNLTVKAKLCHGRVLVTELITSKACSISQQPR